MGLEREEEGEEDRQGFLLEWEAEVPITSISLRPNISLLLLED